MQQVRSSIISRIITAQPDGSAVPDTALPGESILTIVALSSARTAPNGVMAPRKMNMPLRPIHNGWMTALSRANIPESIFKWVSLRRGCWLPVKAGGSCLQLQVPGQLLPGTAVDDQLPDPGLPRTYAERPIRLDIDLSSLAGHNGRILPGVMANGSSQQDWAVWLMPTIRR